MDIFRIFVPPLIKDKNMNGWRRWLLGISACLLSLCAWAVRVDTLQVRSLAMNKQVEVVVICPDAAERKACPVVYLLHGHGGDAHTWLGTTKPELPEIADEKGLFFVCPDGEASWYWDSPLNADVRYETFVSDELVQYIDSCYRTIADRKGRAITGFSMGGHGALWNAIRHSDVFSAVGSTSGGVDIRPFPKNWNMSDQLGEKERFPENWENYTVINQVPQMRNGQLAIIIDCGYGDFFFDVNTRFHEALLKQGVDHDFIVRPGEHNHRYWHNSIDYQILFFQKHFREQGL